MIKSRNRRVLLVGCLLTAVLTGCAGRAGAKFDPDQSSIFVKKDGSVCSAAVEHTDRSYYSEEELGAFAQEQITAFLQENGLSEGEAAPVALTSGEVTGDEGSYKVSCILEYDSPQRLLDFNRYINNSEIQLEQLRTAQLKDCKAELTGLAFTDPSGKSVENGKAVENEQSRVIFCQGPALIQTEGRIQYVTQGCAVSGEYQVQTPESGLSCVIFK